MMHMTRFIILTVVVFTAVGVASSLEYLGAEFAAGFVVGFGLLYVAVRVIHGFWPGDDYRERR